MSHYCTLFTIMSHKSERNSDWNPWRDHNPERKTERIHKQNLNGRWWGRWVVKFDCHREKLFPVWWGQYCPILSVLISTLLIMQPTLKMIKKKKKKPGLPPSVHQHAYTHARTHLCWPPRLSPPDHAKICLLSASPITFDRTLKEYSSTSLNFHYPAWLHSVAAHRLCTRRLSIQSTIHLLNRYSWGCMCMCVSGAAI